MTSARKIAANRRNAARSTGPRSAEGKMRACRNAFKHGLATNARIDPARAPEIERLAQALAGPSSDAARHAMAWAAAEAEIEFRRVCECAAQVLDSELVVIDRENAGCTPGGDEQPSAPSAIMRRLDQLKSIERYKIRSFSRRNRLLRELTQRGG
jgi:hypothetical protein